MDAALVTVGDELLAGDVEDANGTWLGRQLADRGVEVRRRLTVPDEVAAIATAVARYSDRYDAVVVTGGLGDTPDDVTLEGVAAAFDVPLAPNAVARADVERTLAELDVEVDIDLDAEATLPAGARPILNPDGLSPGCVLENVYVLPGVPREMRAMFEVVADEFEGDVAAASLVTDEPEGNLVDCLDEAHDRFDVVVGCYPDRETGHTRLKVRGDEEAVERAAAWLDAQV